MATAPPILIWTPGGGVPIGPVSNPPVYSQHGTTQLVAGQSYVDVVFGSVQTTDDWVLVECIVVNEIDVAPLNIWPGIITDKIASGFRLQLNGLPDSGNYYLHWAVSGINITPVPATSYLLNGPSIGAVGVASTFTVSLPPSTTLAAVVTITPNDGGGGGAFSPASVTLSVGSASATFTYTPASYGARTISVTNSGTLTNPASIAFTCVATAYGFTGPTSGDTGVASTDFTVELPSGSVVIGTVTVTPSDGGDGGTFTPTTVGLTTASPSATFTYTPASYGAKTISVTNNGALTDPSSLTYTVAVTPHLLNTLISYWKMDEVNSGSGVTRNDSQGTNHLLDPSNVASTTGIINNGALLVSANSNYMQCANNSTLQVTGSFTFSVWVKLVSQGGGNVVVFSKDIATVPGTRDYSLDYNAPTQGFAFWANNAYSNEYVVSNTPVANGVWTHVVAWYDSVTTKCSIRLNDTTTVVGTTTGPLIQSAAAFSIGERTGGAAGYIDAVIDEVGFWKRLLTSAEITLLYNSGAGYPFSSFAL